MIDFKKLAFGILLFIIGLTASAQLEKLSFQQLTFENGLPFNKTCNVLLQDHDGFIWMGSDVGLHRFDGNDYRNFINLTEDKKSIRKGKVNAIFQDKSEKLWIGTSTGADLFDPNQSDFVHISLLTDTTITSLNQSVRGFIENSNGDLYCFTHFYIYKYWADRKCFIRVNTGFEVIDKGNFIHESMIISKDYFLSGANTSGIFVFSIAGEKLCNIDAKLLGSNKVMNVFQSSSGQIWIGTDKGICVASSIDELVTNPKKSLEIITEAKGKLVNKIVEDKDGRIWASTDGDGIYNINPKTLSVLKVQQNDDYKESILNNKVALIYVDNHNNLWSFFNSYGFSVSNLKQNGTFQTFTSRSRMGNCLSGNIVTALAQDNSGKIWIGTDGDGLNCFDQSNGTFTHYFSNPIIKNSLSSNVILSLYVDSDNQLWIGTYQGGLCKYERSSDRFTVFNNVDSDQNSISGNDISAITEDSKGNLLVLTITDGLNILDKFSGKFQRISNDIKDKYKLSHNGGTSLLTDSNGDIWLGTYYGLDRINSNTRIVTKFFNNENDTLTISDNQIDCIFEDSKNNIWVGTASGLNLFEERTQTFKHITTKNGLPNNQINSIIEDNEGNIWLGTNNGLSRLNPLSLRIKNFGEKYDLPGRILLHQSVLKAKNGDLFFGGNRGFTFFNPNHLSTSIFFPQLYITDLKIFDKSILVGEKVNGHVVLKKDISKSESITLHHTENSFSFTFSALDYANTSKVDYYYKMDGFDLDWRKADYRNRSASYTNLDAGNYAFKVKLASGVNDIDGIPVELNVSILPPWWRSWWAFLLYFCVVGGLFTFYLNITISRIKLQRRLFFEKHEHEKDLEINRIKENFYTNITHEFRTPLTLILGPLEHLTEKYKTDSYISEQVQVIKRNANRLLLLINELLDFRKIEASSMHLKVSEENIVDFFSQIARSFESHAEIHNIGLRIEPQQNEIKVWFDKNKLEKVFYNILSNALKYTPDGGTIQCRISLSNQQYVSIEVEDNGIGIPENELIQIFRKYFTAENAIEQYSTGIGLYLTKEIVEMHKGEISARNNTKRGSCFKVRLKLGNNHFSFTELNNSNSNTLIPSTDSMVSVNDAFEVQEDTLIQSDDNGNDKSIILLVEDNDEVRTFIKNELNTKYEVIEAANGKIGLEMAFECIPDLIISDVMMPELDGRSLCLQLKNNPLTSHIPIILLTALSDIENRIEGLDMGADSYITKPFHPRHLTVRVSKLLELRKVLQEKYSIQIGQKQNIFNYQPLDVEKLSVDELFMQRIISIVEKHLPDSDFELDDLCNEMGMKYLQLYRKVKAITNLSLKQFILTLRMKTAEKQLETGKFTISEVAFGVGFSSPTYFSETFKKHFGITPTEYIRKKK
jgi:signal transduction histidine kinase/ligand-binding sensor domain-containing protein/DNA-binding response OmpR family regulator